MVATLTALRLDVGIETYAYHEPFAITGWTWHEQRTVVARLSDAEGRVGRGEASGVYYHGETGESMAAQIEACREQVEAGASRSELLTLLPPGGARNALDAALWELESLRTGVPVTTLAGMPGAKPLLTMATIGVGEPEKMAHRARALGFAKALKLKLDGSSLDEARLRAVRAARPDIALAVDANQGWSLQHLEQILPIAIEVGVQLIEQPLAVGDDEALRGVDSPIPFAADESFQSTEDLPRMKGLYQIANLKLDKTGGLTAALDAAKQAHAAGFRLMVGNMGGSSLAMAPHWVFGQMCEFADVDGPLGLARDSTPSLVYADGTVDCPPGLWGAP